MLDVFEICNIVLLCVLAILIFKNKEWKNQPIFIACSVFVAIAVILTIIFF